MVGVDASHQAGNDADEQSEILPSLDSSLERVFGPGTTLLAKELESHTEKKEELVSSETELISDNEVEYLNVSTPAKDKRKKRVRNNTKFEDLSTIKGIKDNHDAYSEGENSEEPIKEVKKPRLRESSKTHEDNNNIEELAEEKVVDKDHTEVSKE